MQPKLLEFEEQREGNERLLLFVRASVPLQKVTLELPEINDQFIHLHGSATVRNSDLNNQVTTVTVLNSAIQSSMNIEFSGLPEAVFERLVLRFRPFYAKDDKTNFSKFLTLIARKNLELRDWCSEWRVKWERAVFWRAMGMPTQVPKVNAEKVIEAAFYARYFHFETAKEDQVLAYEAALGKGLLRTAIVSSVWQRSLLVVNLAEEIRAYLSRAGLLSDKEWSAILASYDQPSKYTLSVQGGIGGLQVSPFVDADRWRQL